MIIKIIIKYLHFIYVLCYQWDSMQTDKDAIKGSQKRNCVQTQLTAPLNLLMTDTSDG